MSLLIATRYNAHVVCMFKGKYLHTSQRSMRFSGNYGQRNTPQSVRVFHHLVIHLYGKTDYQSSFKLAAEGENS